MKRISRQSILRYLYDQLTGNFIGFLIGVSATGLVSQFFETRGIRNLWGLSAKKTVIDRDTFSNLEWAISIIVGFLFFEIFMKVVKESLARNFPKYKRAFFRWVIRQEFHLKIRRHIWMMSEKRLVVISALHNGVRQAINRYSKRG